MALTVAQAWHELDTARYKSEFYHMWYVGHHAGLAPPKTLETMDDFHRSPTVMQTRRWLLEGTRRRQSLKTITRAKPALFTPFEAAILVLGEETGDLEHCLRLLAGYFAAEHRLMTWLKKKMTYPVFNLVAASFIAPFPLLFFGHTTAYLLAVSGWLGLIALLGGGLLLAAAKWFQQRPKYVRGRLMRALTVGVEGGLPLGRAIELAVAAAANPAVRAHVGRFSHEELSGQPLSKTFAGCPYVDRPMVAAMEIADKTGNYSDTLKRLAELYEGAEHRN